MRSPDLLCRISRTKRGPQSWPPKHKRPRPRKPSFPGLPNRLLRPLLLKFASITRCRLRVLSQSRRGAFPQLQTDPFQLHLLHQGLERLRHERDCLASQRPQPQPQPQPKKLQCRFQRQCQCDCILSCPRKASRPDRKPHKMHHPPGIALWFT